MSTPKVPLTFNKLEKTKVENFYEEGAPVVKQVLVILVVTTIDKVAFVFRIIVLGPISWGHTMKIVICTVTLDEIMMKLPYNSLVGVKRTLALKTRVKLDTDLAIGPDTFKHPYRWTFNMNQRRI